MFEDMEDDMYDSYDMGYDPYDTIPFGDAQRFEDNLVALDNEGMDYENEEDDDDTD